jgi:hypothetical protein
LAYQTSWHGGFIWDDDAYVAQNPLLTAKDGLWRIWFSLDSPSQYFPLTYTVFRLERTLWGLNTTGYHWVNLLLHSANALCFGASFGGWERHALAGRGNVRPAPLHVESVA